MEEAQTEALRHAIMGLTNDDDKSDNFTPRTSMREMMNILEQEKSYPKALQEFSRRYNIAPPEFGDSSESPQFKYYCKFLGRTYSKSNIHWAEAHHRAALAPCFDLMQQHCD